MTASDYLQIGLQVIGAAATIATIIPVPQAVGPLTLAYKILNVFAMNMGQAKNEKTPPAP